MNPDDFLQLRGTYQAVLRQVCAVNQLLACDNEAWQKLGEELPQTLALPVVEWAVLDVAQREEMTELLQAVQEQLARFNAETGNWHARRQGQLNSMQMQRKILQRYNR